MNGGKKARHQLDKANTFTSPEHGFGEAVSPLGIPLAKLAKPTLWKLFLKLWKLWKLTHAMPNGEAHHHSKMIVVDWLMLHR